jgi:hypothetical protein
MAFSRYRSDAKINLGQQIGQANAVRRLRREIKNGSIAIIGVTTLTGDNRLDTVSGEVYGDSRYWWVLAAASDIGWGLQVPAGTVINIVDLRDVERMFG